MPAVLERPVPTLNKLKEAIRLRTQIKSLERRLESLFARPRMDRNSHGLSASEMDKIGMKLHARAKKRIASGQSKEFTGSIEDSL